MYNVRPRCGQTITHHYMPSARLLYPHERVGPCPLDKLYPCSHTTINYLKNVPLVSYYYNAMWSNGSVYTTCGSLTIRFHNKPDYCLEFAIQWLEERKSEHVVCTMLETVGTKWVVLVGESAAGQPSLCAGYCVDRVGRLFCQPSNCIVWLFIFLLN